MSTSAQSSAGQRRFGVWIPVVVVMAVVVTLVAGLLIRAGVTNASRSVSNTGNTEVSSHWRTYHDPFGLYTVQLPPGWIAQTEPASTYYNVGSGTIKVNVEIITFSNPSQGTGSAHFYATANPIKTSYEHQYFCQDPSIVQNFAPMSLTTMEHTGAVALFETENGAFQIDVEIPGIVEPATTVPQYSTPPPTATPLPANWIATDQTEVNRMLTSFQPTDPKPLVC